MDATPVTGYDMQMGNRRSDAVVNYIALQGVIVWLD
jgi:hypothetical protein